MADDDPKPETIDGPKPERHYLDEVFGDDGLFAKAFQGYKKRPGQLAMTKGIDEAIAAGEPIVVEGPTGTGKSVSYLVPAIRAITDPLVRRKLIERRTPSSNEERPVFVDSKQCGEESPRVLVVTAGLNLQDQLVNKDLPMLRKLLPWPFRYKVAKGRSNYACHFRLASTHVLELEEADYDQWSAIEEWVQKTGTGDLAELPFEVRPSLRPRVSVSAEECHGSHCSFHSKCFAMGARDEAGMSEVVVANFHLLLSHLKASKEGGATSILPKYDVLILDEVHELPNMSRRFLGFHIGPRDLKEPLKLLPAKHPLRRIVEQEIESFFDALANYRRSPNYKARLRDPYTFAHEPIMGALTQLADHFQKEANGISTDEERDELGSRRLSEDEKREQNELRKASTRLKEHAKNIEEACLMTDQERTVYFIAQEQGPFGHERFLLSGEPIEPAPLLRALIFDAPEPKEPGEVKRKLPIAIATSATLSTMDDGTEKAIGYMASRMGAQGAKRLVVKSPFDIQKQALTVFPRDAPDSKGPNYPELVAPLFVKCIELSRGRTLGLFTSKKALDIVTAHVRKALGDKYLILKQGDAPRVKLVERFRKDVSSCLFGVKSFWAGVDVPGEALSQVLIDKIPFDPPDDPVLDALQAKEGKAVFLNHSIPRAAIELRQAFGRLIRSEADRGVVVLFDQRFFGTGWGKMLVKALPVTTVTFDIDDIGKFFAQEKTA